MVSSPGSVDGSVSAGVSGSVSGSVEGSVVGWRLWFRLYREFRLRLGWCLRFGFRFRRWFRRLGNMISRQLHVSVTTSLQRSVSAPHSYNYLCLPSFLFPVQTTPLLHTPWFRLPHHRNRRIRYRFGRCPTHGS